MHPPAFNSSIMNDSSYLTDTYLSSKKRWYQFSDFAIKETVSRQEGLRALVMKREEVAVAIAKREIIDAVRNREIEVDAACLRHELIKKKADARIQWALVKENGLKAEEMKLEDVKGSWEEMRRRCHSKVPPQQQRRKVR
jgi:hypothetical protein